MSGARPGDCAGNAGGGSIRPRHPDWKHERRLLSSGKRAFEHLHQIDSGMRSSVQVTQGSVENLRLLEAGDGELAFSLGDTVSPPGRATPRQASRRRWQNCAASRRSIATMFNCRERGVRSQNRCRPQGQAGLVGPKQSGTELNARAIFAAADVSYGDFARTDYLPFGQSAKLIEKGDLDATLQSAGLGSLRSVTCRRPCRSGCWRYPRRR